MQLKLKCPIVHVGQVSSIMCHNYCLPHYVPWGQIGGRHEDFPQFMCPKSEEFDLFLEIVY